MGIFLSYCAVILFKFLLHPCVYILLILTFLDVTMAANFTISSDSDSEPSEEVEEGDNNQTVNGRQQQVPQRHSLAIPELRVPGKTP